MQSRNGEAQIIPFTFLKVDSNGPCTWLISPEKVCLNHFVECSQLLMSVGPCGEEGQTVLVVLEIGSIFLDSNPVTCNKNCKTAQPL